MEATLCNYCSKNQTAIRCDACQVASCRHCSYFVDEDSFDFLSLLPERLIHKTFCPTCYNGDISSEIDEFHRILGLAKEVNIFHKEQGAETRFFKRIEKPVKVENQEDKEEAQLILAFLAAQRGFNTLVDFELKSKKIKLGGTYAKLVWSGTAIPMNVNVND